MKMRMCINAFGAVQEKQQSPSNDEHLWGIQSLNDVESEPKPEHRENLGLNTRLKDLWGAHDKID